MMEIHFYRLHGDIYTMGTNSLLEWIDAYLQRLVFIMLFNLKKGKTSWKHA